MNGVDEIYVGEWWDNLNDEEFQLTFRMSRKSFTALQAELDNAEEKENNVLDKSLLACLWILGNNEAFESVKTVFLKDDDIDIDDIITKYLKKITSLGKVYVAWPDRREAEIIENGFASKYGFPGVIGVIGSLHINICASSKKSIYFNPETKNHTIVLQVVCDNNLLLRDICVGCPGGKSIETILKSSPLYQKLIDDNDDMVLSKMHLLGGTQHPHLDTLLTPYRGHGLIERHKKFNELHNSVMFTVEQSFRCLENRFPRLTSIGSLDPTIVTLLVSATCVLHNFTRVRNDSVNLYL